VFAELRGGGPGGTAGAEGYAKVIWSSYRIGSAGCYSSRTTTVGPSRRPLRRIEDDSWGDSVIQTETVDDRSHVQLYSTDSQQHAHKERLQ